MAIRFQGYLMRQAYTAAQAGTALRQRMMRGISQKAASSS